MLPRRILCLVTDLQRAGGAEQLLACVEKAVSGGVNMVQARAHDLDSDALTVLAIAVVDRVGNDALVVVNGPAEVAACAGAAGVHYREDAVAGNEDIPVNATRLLRGRSVHSVEAAAAAESEGMDYLVVGTVFASASHPGETTGGLDLVRRVCEAVNLPALGIGGITPRNAAQVIEAGAQGIAVISAIIGQSDPGHAARQLADRIGL